MMLLENYRRKMAMKMGMISVSKEYYEKHANDVTKHEDAIAYCRVKPIGNDNKVKTEVIRYPNHGARKWVTRYVAKPRYSDTKQHIEAETLQECIAKARAYVDKNPEERLDIIITKKLLGKEDSNLCAEIKYKPSSKERDGEWDIAGAMSW
jgi:hypothetical protein